MLCNLLFWVALDCSKFPNSITVKDKVPIGCVSNSQSPESRGALILETRVEHAYCLMKVLYKLRVGLVPQRILAVTK